ncbi:MAG: hypothetical protein ACRDYU_04790 [Actinomycetes bacterium]
MPAWESWSYVFGPLTVLLVIGLLVLTLRWAFGRGASLVERDPRPGPVSDYGLLVPVAEPSGPAETEEMYRTLEAAGLRATVAPTTQGTRMLVFEGDAAEARRLLASRRQGRA